MSRLAAVVTIVVTFVVTVTVTAGAGVAVAEAEPCERGEFCLWSGEEYSGDIHRIALENTNPGECVPLPATIDARSFANRTTRPVTVYQGRDCATEGEFDTYPGGGTYVPAAPYVVRGVQLWNS
jgi:Peptidase inhibitor family I36